MLYASPIDERPKRLTMNNAMRCPNPDFTTACATRKATTTSSTLEFANPANAFSGEMVLVRTTAPAASMVEVSSVYRLSSTDTIAVANIANRCQACGVKPAGTGENHMATAITKGSARFSIVLTSMLVAGAVAVFVAVPRLLITDSVPQLTRPADWLRGLVPSSPWTVPERFRLRSRAG